MDNSNTKELKLPEALDLLKEFKELPQLQHTMVGKKYTEQVKYFKEVDKSYQVAKAAVEQLRAEYDTTFPKTEHETIIIKMPVLERPKNQPPSKKVQQEISAPAIDAAMTPAHAMSWINETMKFLEHCKTAYENTKDDFNKKYDDVKGQCDLPTLPEFLRILHLFQHPEDAANLMFVQELRRDGADRWLAVLDHNATFVAEAQIITDGYLATAEFHLTSLEPVTEVIDTIHAVILKIYARIMQMGIDKVQSEPYSEHEAQFMMRLVEVYTEVKKPLEAYCYHMQRFNEYMLNLQHIYARQQNIQCRTHVLYACLMKRIFFEKE
jgi:hypothetical protein